MSSKKNTQKLKKKSESNTLHHIFSHGMKMMCYWSGLGEKWWLYRDVLKLKWFNCSWFMIQFAVNLQKISKPFLVRDFQKFQNFEVIFWWRCKIWILKSFDLKKKDCWFTWIENLFDLDLNSNRLDMLVYLNSIFKSILSRCWSRFFLFQQLVWRWMVSTLRYPTRSNRKFNLKNN